MEILGRLQPTFRKVFDDAELTVERRTGAHDIESWDWEHHALLILEIESEWEIEFSISETAYIKTVGDIMDLITGKRRDIIG